ncbi:multidrug resistance-associated protein 1 [Plakobranchus ocellatus]|uniref:Multidrug resistance-associated protein 1 n=1 Tax=Plakobranchus ocellatus TaxID=259542 RepID=A0AAV3ZPY9_9GAST|nr:multidrug resistance-associated protein 1 [Plakobranchus ocellatus]
MRVEVSQHEKGLRKLLKEFSQFRNWGIGRQAPWTGPHDKDLNTKPSPLNTTTKLNKSNQKLISIFRDTRRAEPKAVGDPYICRSLPDYGAIPSILSEPRPRSASPIGFLHKALKGNIYSSLSARGADKISSVDNKSFSGSSEGLEKISRVELIKSTSVCPRAESQQAIKSNSICLRAESQHASLTWPHTGHIQFVNFSCRYRKETERVLKQISFTIKGGEKIGVVGRTGAGKSSLVLSLFRLVEADEGKILIDGVDISTLGLHRLRQALTILPQDPVLFAGSLRENLDPSGKRSEVELWRALDHAHLKQFVSILPGQLDAVVSDGGGNLSMGQRQLVCLARTLLCQTRVLVLDEATAAVDLETDHLVQQTIHSSFRACTVIAIAHRLSSIIDYDRVLVLDQGVVVEFDSPKRLLENPLTAFHSLAKEAGIVSHRNSHL